MKAIRELQEAIDHPRDTDPAEVLIWKCLLEVLLDEERLS